MNNIINSCFLYICEVAFVDEVVVADVHMDACRW